MRKLLVLALIAVAALVVMAQPQVKHYSGGANVTWSNNPGALTGTIEVHVYQWADATLTVYSGSFDIFDYNQEASEAIAELEVDSNYTFRIDAAVRVYKGNNEITATVAASCSKILFWWDTVNKNGEPDTGEPYWNIKNGSFGNNANLGGPGQVVSGDIYLDVIVSNPDLEAGKYTLDLSIWITPEVTF